MHKQMKFTVTEDYNKVKALNFLKKRCGLSTRMITLLKREKDGILMNGKKLRTVDLLDAGAIVTLNLPFEKSAITPVNGKLDIAYEDDNFLIVNKPPFMPVHPVKQHQTDTLANIVAYYALNKNEDFTFRAVNRLDKDTSGLVIVAKDKYCANAVKNKITKVYYALCHGKISCDGIIDAPIGLQEGSKIVRCVSPDGCRAVTHYKPLCYNDNYSYLELKLETGKTHQIRCHMSSINYPLLGDDLYGGKRDLINRQALHCGVIAFEHPINKKKLFVTCKLPKDMQIIVSQHLTDKSMA